MESIKDKTFAALSHGGAQPHDLRCRVHCMYTFSYGSLVGAQLNYAAESDFRHEAIACGRIYDRGEFAGIPPALDAVARALSALGFYVVQPVELSTWRREMLRHIVMKRRGLPLDGSVPWSDIVVDLSYVVSNPGQRASDQVGRVDTERRALAS